MQLIYEIRRMCETCGDEIVVNDPRCRKCDECEQALGAEGIESVEIAEQGLD